MCVLIAPDWRLVKRCRGKKEATEVGGCCTRLVCVAPMLYTEVEGPVGGNVGDALWWMFHCSTLESRDRNEKAWPWEAATFRKSSRGHPDSQARQGVPLSPA